MCLNAKFLTKKLLKCFRDMNMNKLVQNAVSLSVIYNLKNKFRTENISIFCFLN